MQMRKRLAHHATVCVSSLIIRSSERSAASTWSRAVELVADKARMASSTLPGKIGLYCYDRARERSDRSAYPDSICFCPPLIITRRKWTI